MTATPHVIVTGGGDAARAVTVALAAAGVTDFRVLDDEPAAQIFDGDTDTWVLRTEGGEAVRGRVVITAHRSPFTPCIPEFAGRNDFRGASFHSARWDPGFDPAGKRVAVVGADSFAGHQLGRLTASAASVTVFAHAPRRIVAELATAPTRARRWLGRRMRPAGTGRPRPAFVTSPIAGITPSGIRTNDGVEHRADVIVYGTGFTVAGDAVVGADGVTLRRAWTDGMEPYFGVAVHGFPNCFFITGPDIGTQSRYVAECTRLMARRGSARIEVRRSTQQVFNERACVRPAQPHRIAAAFELWPERADTETYDGEATLTIAGDRHPVRARLAGHLDPIDGQYHWQGTIFGFFLPDEVVQQSRTSTLTVGERSAPARIVEKTPWGTHSVAGVGAPPYAIG